MHVYFFLNPFGTALYRKTCVTLIPSDLCPTPGGGCSPMADSYANPIPSLRFLSGRKNKHRECESKPRLNDIVRNCEVGCGDGARATFFLFARVIQQSGFSSQRQVLLTRKAPSALRSALDSKASKPALTDSSLAAKRRAAALHVWY